MDDRQIDRHHDRHQLNSVAGCPVIDNQNTTTVGPRGPALLQDVWMIEKFAHFDREVIPERRMHAKGFGAFGNFKVTHDISKYTKAKLFSRVGKSCDIFVRFSNASGERGIADVERDVRGFAVKFYTEEGNWDLVGNNTPVFYVRDPLKFIDMAHVLKRDPQTHLRNRAAKFDFFSSLPESMHQLTIDFSDRGIPASYRTMHGFGSHTFSMINEENHRTWVKFHWICRQSITSLDDDTAEELIGKDRDSLGRDLYEAIQRKDYPQWELNIQVMSEKQAAEAKCNPFDLTKVWSHKDFPLIPVGIMELNRLPEDYFRDVEQALFSPAHVIPGISFSPDRMLQSRLFSYGDAGRYRLGVNNYQIPVNHPRCPVGIFHRDGLMRIDRNGSGGVNYEPNSFGHFKESARNDVPSLGPDAVDKRHAFIADRYDHREDDDDYYSQPRALWNIFDREQKARVCRRFGAELAYASKTAQEKMLSHIKQVAQDYADGVKRGIELEAQRMSKNPSLIDVIHQIGDIEKRKGVHSV